MIREYLVSTFYDGKKTMEYQGLSTDEKPTSVAATGSIFVEVDTGKVFFFDEESAEWIEQFTLQTESGSKSVSTLTKGAVSPTKSAPTVNEQEAEEEPVEDEPAEIEPVEVEDEPTNDEPEAEAPVEDEPVEEEPEAEQPAEEEPEAEER